LELWRNKVNRLPFDYLDYGVLIGMPCKYGMYAVSTYHKDEWYMTWQGLVVFEYGFKIHDRNNYCMDTFQNKLELDRSFHLFICLKKPDKFDLKKQIKSETN